MNYTLATQPIMISVPFSIHQTQKLDHEARPTTHITHNSPGPVYPPILKTPHHKKFSPTPNQARFLNTLPVPVVLDGAPALTAGGFLVVPAATPFLMVPITVLFAGGGAGGLGWAPGGAVIGRFLTTVEVLASLDSELLLALRAVRVAGLDGGWEGGAMDAAVVAARFLLAAIDPVVVVVVELAVVEAVVVVVLRAAAAAAAAAAVVVAGAVRVDRALSVMLFRMLVATPAPLPPGVITGRAMPDLAGVAPTRSRGAILELEVVGDRTWPGLRALSIVV